MRSGFVKALPLLHPSGLSLKIPFGYYGTSHLCTMDLCFWLCFAFAMIWHTFKCFQNFRQLHACIMLSCPFKDGGSKHYTYIVWFLMNPVEESKRCNTLEFLSISVYTMTIPNKGICWVVIKITVACWSCWVSGYQLWLHFIFQWRFISTLCYC